MRTRRSSRSVVALVAWGFIGGIAGGLAVLLAEGSVGTCLQAFDDARASFGMTYGEHHCISMVDPFVVESGTQQLTAPPRLLSDPSDARQRLHPLGRELDSAVSGVATVRFHVTDQGGVSDPRVIETSGYEVLDEAIAAIATAFEFSPGTTASGPVEVPMEYVVGFQADTRGRLLRWMSAIGT